MNPDKTPALVADITFLIMLAIPLLWGRVEEKEDLAATAKQTSRDFKLRSLIQKTDKRLGSDLFCQ